MSNTGDGLPFLPGNTFRDATKSAFHRPQTLTYSNGYVLPRRPIVGIGQAPLLSEQLTQNEIDELSNETPARTYGSSSHAQSVDFIPANVAFDKKVLRFHGYFYQDVLHSPKEQLCVRHVVLYYYLEDDSMLVIEPMVENSGIPQGKLIKRQRLPKNDKGDHYHWKDLNIGMDLVVYGVIYHITHCDSYTKEFMESEGLIVNDSELTPLDPYITRRQVQPQQSYVTPSDFDCLEQFLTLDRKVLRFFAVWDNTDTLYGETRSVTIQYYLVDNTVEVRDVHEPNSGRDPCPVLMHRQRLPKTMVPACESFPSCVLEVSQQEVQEYYSPKDFQVGETIKLLGRCFLLYDCDAFTKTYYEKNHPAVEMKPVVEPKKTSVLLQDRKRVVPPYNGFGSLEDSLQNCLTLVPKPCKKEKMKLKNDGQVLRYTARLDSQNPQDEGRHFILSYHLSNDMISIFERSTLNSGRIGGKFLQMTSVPKPGCRLDNPVFYSPADLAIGATVEVFYHRFVLTDADHYVLKYLESISDQIPGRTLDSLRHRLGVEPDQGPTDALSGMGQMGDSDVAVLSS